MNIELSRRQFVHGVAASVAGTSLGALGFGDIEKAYATSIRAWKRPDRSARKARSGTCRTPMRSFNS